MATHDYVIDNSTGANVRADINNVLQAILTNNSSSSAPSTTAAYMWWADTNAGVLKIRNSANNDWVELLQLDGTLTLEDGSASTPGLAFRDDLNTGIFSSAADTFNVATAGVERMELGATTIFNEDGADVDFRIEGDTEANLFYVDAGNERIGIHTGTPSDLVHILDDGADATIRLESTNSGGDSRIKMIANSSGKSEIMLGDNDDSDVGLILYNHSDNNLSFNTSASERMRIDSSGNVGIGTTSPARLLHLQNSSDFGIRLTKTAASDAEIKNTNSLDLCCSSGGSGGQIIRMLTGANTSSLNEVMRVDGGQKVAIGTTTTTEKLIVAGAIDFTGAATGNTANSGKLSYESGTAFLQSKGPDTSTRGKIGFNIAHSDGGSGITAMTIDTSGNVGIGTDDPNGESINGSQNLVIMDTTSDGGMNIKTGTSGNAQIHFSDTSGNGQGRLIYAHANDSMQFYTAGSERMRIDSSGRLLIGATANIVNGSSSKVQVSYSKTGEFGIFIRPSDNNTGGGQPMLFQNQAGTSIGSIGADASNVSFNESSDYRLKENDVAILDGITRLKKLRPIRFNWKVAPEKTRDGFFAHEVSEAVPEAVTGEKDGTEIQQLDNSKLVPLLVAAVQELITKVETLEAA